MRRIEVKGSPPDGRLVQQAEAAVRQGLLVALPTETVYGLAADPTNPASVARLRAVKGRGARHAFTHHIASAAGLTALAPAPPPRVQRLMGRYWPGPVTLVLPAHGGHTVGVRVPAHPFTAAVLAGFPQGLFLSSANRSGQPPLAGPAEIAAGLPEVDLLFDAGPPALGVASALVLCVGAQLEVAREGTLTRDELLRTAACSVLFVCTGNTCRSPLAEAIARRRTASALGVTADSLLARGLRFASAGTATFDDMPASENAIRVAAEVGLDLSAHRSAALRAADAAEAAQLWAMSQTHLRAALELAPALGDRAALLDPGGDDIQDPFGSELGAYRSAVEAIAAAVEGRLPEIVRLLEG